MLLTLHASAGAFLGEIAPNATIAFALGFLSHFPLDVFPHGDRAFAQRAKGSPREARRYIVFIASDVVFGIAILAAGFLLGKFEHPSFALLGMLGGLLPDLIVALPEYALFVRGSPRARLLPFYRFHDFVHNQLARFDVPFPVGIVGQGFILALLWRLW